MNIIFTEEMRVRLEQLEYDEENRKAKARRASKKWREEHAEKVAQQRAKAAQDRAELMAELARLRKLHEAAPKTAPAPAPQPHENNDDASMNQIL